MRKLTYFIISTLLVFSFIGCNKAINPNNSSKDKKTLTSENENKEKINKEVKENKREAYLYFSDDEAMYLHKEEVKLDKITPNLLMEKLKEGPKQKHNLSVIPKDLDIKVKLNGKTAYVNLPKNISKKLTLGSAVETMFVYSIVNTLTLNKDLGIEQVKFLIDGKETDSITGHMEISEPIKANKSLIK